MVRPGYKECPYCAEEILEKAIKCRFCQSMLTGAPPPPTESSIAPEVDAQQQQWAKLRKYLPARVAESILQGSDITDEGERKQITVMFADLASFTSLSEEMDPEAVKFLMDDCFEVMVECIERYGGTIDKYMGDAVMALFGAPQAHEDDPERAIRAAAEMRDAIRFLGESRNLDLQLSFGISTGEVVVGGLGSQKHMEYTAIGDRVNLAARLEGVAQAGQIVISEATYHSVCEIFKTQMLGPLQLKGLRKSVTAYLVTDIGRTSTHETRLSRMVLSPLVGREAHLDQLEHWVKDAGGQASFIHLIGEAGVGKTRLLLELNNRLQIPGERILTARCVSYGQSFPYHPLVDCLKSFCGIREQDHRERMEEAVHQTFGAGFQSPEEKEEVLRYLLALTPLPGGKLMEFPPRERQEKVFEGLAAILLELAARDPIHLILEDLHWADPATLAFLDYALPRLVHAPIHVFLIYRPYLQHVWPPDVEHRFLNLQELSQEDSGILLNKILDIPELPPERKQEILVKSEGNPFYVEEMVRAFVDFGVIRRTDGQYEVTGDLASVPVPDTLQGLILARIDRLAVQVKRILQCASVIGNQFRIRLLEYLAGVQRQLRDYLTELAGMELIYEKSAMPELEYLFQHILTQEVTYNTLLTRTRREYHGRIALCLEEIYPDRLHEHYELIAHHYSHSNYTDKAIEYCWKAGEKCRLLFANEAAITFYTSRLQLMPESPRTGEETRERIRTLLARGSVFQMIGRTDDAEKDYEEALELAHRQKETVLLGDAELAAGDLARMAGDYTRAEALLRSALVHYNIPEGREGAFAARRGLAVLQWNRGRYTEARQSFTEILSSGGQPSGLWDLAHNWNNLGLVEWNLGHYREAAEALRKSLDYRGELSDKKGSIAGLNNLGIVLERLGEYDAAREAYLQALTLAREIEFVLGEAATRVNLGQVYTLQGNYEMAQEHYAEALKLAQNSRDTHTEAMVLGNIGQACCAQNRLEEAEHWLNLAHEKSKGIGDHDSLMNAELGLADLDLHCGNPGSARDRLEQALASAKERAHEDSIIPLRRLLARCYRKLGDAEKARKEAARALESARRTHHRAEEMWALYELGKIDGMKSGNGADEIQQALAIAKELDMLKVVEGMEI